METFSLIGAGIDIALVALIAVTVAAIGILGTDLWKAPFPIPAAKSQRWEFWLALIGSIGGGAVYLGLAGTVAHIIVALSSLKGAHADIGVISGPVALALKSTLLGLASAVPAAVAHPLLAARLDSLREENTA